MLIKTISFETYEFSFVKVGNETVRSMERREFLVENTPENYARIVKMKNAREITFGKMFDFQFEKEMKFHTGLVDPIVWAKLWNSERDLFLAAAAEEMVS